MTHPATKHNDDHDVLLVLMPMAAATCLKKELVACTNDHPTSAL
jgi:hypothetical protein